MKKPNEEPEVIEDLDLSQELAFLLEEEKEDSHEQDQPRTR